MADHIGRPCVGEHTFFAVLLVLLSLTHSKRQLEQGRRARCQGEPLPLGTTAMPLFNKASQQIQLPLQPAGRAHGVLPSVSANAVFHSDAASTDWEYSTLGGGCRRLKRTQMEAESPGYEAHPAVPLLCFWFLISGIGFRWQRFLPSVNRIEEFQESGLRPIKMLWRIRGSRGPPPAHLRRRILSIFPARFSFRDGT